MEKMVIDKAFWRGRRVFITGHTGFKGAWLSLLLSRLGAEVHGYALAPEGEEWLFNVANVESDIHHTVGDVCDTTALKRALRDAKPSIVLHLAAQALVRRSYREPDKTYATNVMGTVNILDAVRETPDIEALIVVTSDKCYENVDKVEGYNETDRLGGHDPYSNSKACAELVTAAYRSSFFSNTGACRIASVRAGNVIGGGDWAQDRLVPDTVRAFMAGESVKIRNPRATRPWQHVLDPLIGYLLLAERLSQSADWAEAWNIGPEADETLLVQDIVEALAHRWGNAAHWEHDTGDHPHEARLLSIDCSKAKTRLGWRPQLTTAAALDLTTRWYRAYGDGRDMRAETLAQISQYLPAV